MGAARDFYSAGAQIVPVLYIALVVEMRFLAWREHHLRIYRAIWLLPILVTVLFILAEIFFMAPLLTGQDTGLTRTLATFGLGFTGGIVLMIPVMSWHFDGADHAKERHQTKLAESLDRRAAVAGYVVVGAALIPGLVVAFGSLP